MSENVTFAKFIADVLTSAISFSVLYVTNEKG